MVRGKQPEADLRRTYSSVLFRSISVSALLNVLLLFLFPSFEPKPIAQPSSEVIIQLEEIPETAQQRRPPPPPRPVVPIASSDETISEDITIETTDLDLSLDHLIPPPPPLSSEKDQLEEKIELEVEEEEIVELWQVEKEPEVIKKVVPKYPEVARKAGIEDKVFIHVLVGKDGKVERLGKLVGPEIFHQSVKAAAAQWTFTPAIQNDSPVKVWLMLPFDFRLQ